MSFSKINPPEELPPVLSSKTTSSPTTILSKRWMLGIGLSSVGLVLFLIFKSFSTSYFSFFSEKERFLRNKPITFFESTQSQISQDLKNQKAESQSSATQPTTSQAAVSQVEPLPHSSQMANSADTSNNSASLAIDGSSVTSRASEDNLSSSPATKQTPDDASLSESIVENQAPDINPNQINVLALENKIQTLEQRLREEENEKIHKSQIWLKFQQLHVALDQSRSFEAEWQQFSMLFSPQSKIFHTLHVLEPYAKTGLLSFDQLLQKFRLVKQEALQMFEQQQTGWHKLRLQLMPWIQIYNTQIVDPTSINLGLLLNLEKAVKTQDLDQIIQIIQPLKQDNLPTLNIWRQQIQTYQHLTQIKKALLDQTIAEIVQPSTLNLII